MLNFNFHTDRLQQMHVDITEKYKDKNNDSFLFNLYINTSSAFEVSTFYSNGTVYKVLETETSSDDEDALIETVHFRFDSEKKIYENLLPNGSHFLDHDIPEIIESYDEFGNRIEHFGDKLMYKYNSDGEMVERTYWGEKNQAWIKQFFYYSGNQAKMLISDNENNLRLLLLSKYEKGNETERFVYDSGLELKLHTRQEYDENDHRISTIHYLPDETIAWRTVQNSPSEKKSFNEINCVYDNSDTFVYKEIEIHDNELGSITVFYMHEKYRKMWDESLNCHNELLLGNLVNLACFGDDKSLWIDPYPEYGFWEW